MEKINTKKINLYIFIDAFGWEIYRENEWFLADIIEVKKPLKTVFGYSSACVPSIITGKTPAQHRHWASFYYSPETSPFKALRYLKILPKVISERARVRRYLSVVIKKRCGFTGYFLLYNTPFKYLLYFDYQEKNDIYSENGIKGCKTVFDKLRKKGVPFFMEKSHSDGAKFKKLCKALRESRIEFAYLHLGELDGLLHSNKSDSAIIRKKIKDFDIKIREAYVLAKKYYDEVNLIVFSDHGMKETEATYDLMKDIESLNLTYGKDYAAYYDSTMARFWFLNDAAKDKITDKLNQTKQGKVFSDDELKTLGVYFEDHKDGDLIFLMNPGILIVPSFMGKKAVCGMHGYHPDDPDSWATYLSNKDNGKQVQTIMDVFDF